VIGDPSGSPPPGPRDGSAFSHILDEVARSDERRRGFEPAGETPGHSFATFAPPIDPAEGGPSGPAERWDQALDWIAEPHEAAGAPRTAKTPSDDADSIAAELGLTSALTRNELNRARRRFMWNNHPDRRPDVPRELANRRVAIANMLVDRAQRALARRRRAT